MYIKQYENYIFKCEGCNSFIEKRTDKGVEYAKNHSEIHTGCKYGGTFFYYTPVGTPVIAVGHYTNNKTKKIENFICSHCKDKECPRTLDILNLCQTESVEYKLRTLSSSASTPSIGKEIEVVSDIEGVVLGGVPVRIADIKRLFVARDDKYSLQNPKEPERFPDVEKPLTDDVIFMSLLGAMTIGVRPVNPENNLTKWICYDIDPSSCKGTICEGNPKELADLVVKLLKEWYNLTGYVELSGSKDSYHVWIFIEPTDNAIVWKFDQDFKNKCETEPQINKGINPRVKRGEGQMFKLPYMIQLKNRVRSRFIDGIDISKIQPEKLPVSEEVQKITV